MIKRVVQNNNRKMNKIMKSKRSPLGLLHRASVASEGASTTGQKRQAKIAVLELSLGRELKWWTLTLD